MRLDRIVPALTSGHLFQVPVMLTALATAAAMSLIASSIYLLNDVLDIDSDRAHRTKWARPVAHGDLSIPEAAVISCVLASAGLAAGWAIGGPSLVACLLVYLAITTAYSWRFKAVMVGESQDHSLVGFLIAQGQLTGRVPSIHEISQHHHVSHHIANRAMSILEGEGLLVKVPGEGHYVRERNN